MQKEKEEEEEEQEKEEGEEEEEREISCLAQASGSLTSLLPAGPFHPSFGAASPGTAKGQAAVCAVGHTGAVHTQGTLLCGSEKTRVQIWRTPNSIGQ